MSKILDGQIALVTGASRGIGYAAARLLAAHGAHIIALARTTGGLEELDDEVKALGSTATLVPMDLEMGPEIDQLGAAVAERWGKLDILVGNAGILGELGPAPHLEPKLWDRVLKVNTTANVRLIRNFDPLLRAADAGRALFMTSTVGAEPRAYWAGYAASKAALESFVLSYAKELQKSNVCVNLLNPGGTHTAMRSQAMPGEDVTKLSTPEMAAEGVLKMVSPDWTRSGEVLHLSDLSS